MKRKRAIVFLSTPLTPLNGELHLSERAHVLTLQLLAERFEDVAVVARTRDKAVLSSTEHVSLASTGARLAHELPDFGGRAAVFSSAAMLFPSRHQFAQLVTLASPADLLFAEVPSLEGLLVWRLARRLARPYVIEMRGEGILNAAYMRARIGIAGRAANRVIRFGFELVRRDAIGALFVGEELRKRYAPSGAVTAVASSVRLPPNTPRPPRLHEAPAKAFLFIGHLEKIKSVHVILSALEQIAGQLPPDWRLDIIGDGPERHALATQAQAAGISTHVHFHGRVAWGADLFRFYEAADLLVMASLTEGNSRTLLEAMAFALPALSTAVGEAPRHLLADALVPPSSPDEFSAALSRIAQSPSLLNTLSAHNARQVVNYAPDELRRRRAAFIDTVLALPRVRTRTGET